MSFLEQDFSVRFRYKVYFTEHIFDFTNPLLTDFFTEQAGGEFDRKVLFVLDGNVVSTHPGLLADITAFFNHFKTVSLASEFIILNGGEQVKNDPDSLETVLEAINYHKIDRHSYLAVIGGGAVLDLGGYAAAIAHRGIRLLRFPTTVLSQNDSGVGVKNGINYFKKKNFLGTFSTPAAVFNDKSFLSTLDARNWRSGIAEAIKVALIKDSAFFYWIQEHTLGLVERDAQLMQTLIHTCAKLHLEHISGPDPFENGSSRPLDFGHWAAHKIEYLTDYTLLHGEAVAIGIALDSIYSNLAGFLNDDNLKKILSLLGKIGFDLGHIVLDREEELFQGLNEFREHLGGRLTIMLLSDIGTGINVNVIDRVLFHKSIMLLKEFSLIEKS